jgi:hypothetical protein
MDLLSWMYSKTTKEYLKPKEMLYNCLTFSLLLMFFVAQEVDSMMQEGDHVVDAFLLICLAYMWMTQPAHLRHKDVHACIAIVLCIKVSYFLDKERSLNFTTEPELTEWRIWVR